MRPLSRIAVRLRSPWISITGAIGLVGVVIHVILVRTDRSSGGSAILVIVPVLVGLALGVSGILWLRFKERHADSCSCAACGYDLSGLLRREDAVRCPECGRMCAQGADAPHGLGLSAWIAGCLVRLPGLIFVLGSGLFLLIAFVYSVAWQSGWLGDL